MDLRVSPDITYLLSFLFQRTFPTWQRIEVVQLSGFKRLVSSGNFIFKNRSIVFGSRRLGGRLNKDVTRSLTQTATQVVWHTRLI